LVSGALCLFAFGIAAERTRPYSNLAEMLSNPEKFYDQKVALIVECRVVAIIPEGFVLKQGNVVIIAQTSERHVQLDEYVVVEGIFRAPATLEVTRMHVASKRGLKMAISIVPVIVVILLVLKDVGYDRKGGWFYLRKFSDA